MKKKELFACIGALMLSFTSCVKDESVCIATNVESKETMARAEVQSLIQQARYGNADAYHEEKRDTALYRQCLLRMTDKHPMLNAKIAQLYGIFQPKRVAGI